LNAGEHKDLLFQEYYTVFFAKMKNGLGWNVNAGLKPLAQYVEALRAGRWRNESVSTDFHVLRQGIHPRRFEDEKRSWTGCQRGAKAACSEHGSDFDKLNPPPAG